MDEEFDTSVDTSADMDTSDVVDEVPEDIPEDIPEDVPEDIPEDIPEDEPEMTEEDDLSEDIPEDVPEDEPEMTEEDDLSDDIPEDVPEEQQEIEDTSTDVNDGDSAEPTEDVQDEPMDDTTTVEAADDTATNVDNADSTEPTEDIQDEPMDDATTEDTADDVATDVDSADSAEPTEDVQDEPLDDTATEDTADDTAADVDSADSTEPTEDTQAEALDDTTTDEAADDTAADLDSADSAEPTEDVQDEPLDDAATEDTADDVATDVDSADSAEPTEDVQDEPLDDAATEDTADDVATDVDSADSAEPTEDVQDEPMDDATTVKNDDDAASDVSSNDSSEQTSAQKETADDANEFNDGTQDDSSKVLKRDELDLLKSGNDAINQRLEAQADDYRDKGMSEEEIRDRLAADKWNFQKEFLEDAFPGQDVSPNVFNGLSENGSKDRIDEIENSDTLKNQLKKDGTDTTSDNVPVADNKAIESEGRNDGVSDSPEAINDVVEDESIKDLRNRFAAFLNKQDTTANAQNDIKEVNKDVESAQKMIDDYCNNDLKGVLSDDKKAVRLGDTVEFQDDEAFAKGLGGKERAAGVNGYNNGKKSYVKNSGPHPQKTAIHEHNHQLSCNDSKDSLGNITEYKRGVSINGKDRQVNEALTELFTKKMMGSDYPANPNVGYRDNMLRMEKMESGFGTDVLKEAYYQNKPDLLKSKYESVMGEGSWEPFSKSFDDSLSKYSDQEIFDKREHYRKFGTNLQTATDVKRQNAITYANKCATLFALKSKGVN